MDKFEYWVGIIMLLSFLYLCGTALLAGHLSGAILFGGLAVIVIIGFIRDIKNQSSNRRAK